MELNEVGRRIVGQHWVLITVFVVFGLAVAAVLTERTATELYTASSRLVLDAPDPTSRAESTALADTAKAIATSPGRVREALASAGVSGRDADEIAAKRVSVRSLGSSGVLELAVSDPDPDVATAITNALAHEVIAARRAATAGDTELALNEIREELSSLNGQISEVDKEIASLTSEIGRASSPEAANDLRSQQDSLSRVREHLAEQRLERLTLLSSVPGRPEAAVIARAATPKDPDPTGSVTRLLLGLLLGLVLGVGAAALVESVRPTIVGAEALAREFSTPVLGSLGPDLDEGEVERLARMLGIAAVAAKVEAVTLLPVADDIDLEPLGNRLNQTLYADAQRATSEVRGDAGSAPYVVEFQEGQGPEIERMAAVLVSPAQIRKSTAPATHHFLDATNIKILGLVTYEPERRSFLRRLKHHSFAWSQS
jgi:capsular polysaccharide biosynthesis protein